jgi:NADPH:quinone reductase-like Zn-dependent oxidoreductase
MKRITQAKTGGPEVLELAEASDPAPGPGELFVRIAAAGVNPVDEFVRSGACKLLGEPPFTLGWDIAGTVEAVGLATQGFAPGACRAPPGGFSRRRSRGGRWRRPPLARREAAERRPWGSGRLRLRLRGAALPCISGPVAAMRGS